MLILGHRGASAHAPENTLAAFRLAMSQGANGIELDTYQVDDEIVVIHDRWVNRTTNGHGRVIEHKLNDLLKLDAGNGATIPLIAEVLNSLPTTAILNIEIKQLQDVASWLNCLSVALSNSPLTIHNLVISSFNHKWLRAIKQAWPTVKIGALSASYQEDPVTFATVLNAYSVHFALDIVDRNIVYLAKQAGLQVWVFTVDHPQDMLMLNQWGVDGIFTNVPQLALNTMSNSNPIK